MTLNYQALFTIWRYDLYLINFWTNVVLKCYGLLRSAYL